MLIDVLKQLFTRDLNRLRTEIEAYSNESTIWKVDSNITNSAGNLCLHLIGNLNAYIGNQLGASGYIRNRELEFSAKDVPTTELITKIEDTLAIVSKTLDNLKEEQLEQEYPVLVFQEKTTTGYLLVHLTTHLTYHLGQINYHRRLLNN